MRDGTLPLFGSAWATPVPRAEPVRVEFVELPRAEPAPPKGARKAPPRRPSQKGAARAESVSASVAAAIAAVMPEAARVPEAAPANDTVLLPRCAEPAVALGGLNYPEGLSTNPPPSGAKPLMGPPPDTSVIAESLVAEPVAPVRPERGVIVFDVETTGTDRRRDQVIELCVQFGLAEGAPHRTWRIKPDVAISPGAQAVHGISMDDLADCPRFADVIDDIAAVFASAEVVVDYNLIFDIDMVSAEFERVGRPLPDWSSKTVVDPFRLWQQCEPRSLSHAHIRFVGSGFEAAHSAVADVAATGRVLSGMLRSFGLDHHDWRAVAGVCDPSRPSWVGPSRHLQWQGERVVMAFGKHSGTPLSQIERSYLKWMADKDFPVHVGDICRKASELAEPEFLAWVKQAYGAPSPA